MALLNSDSYSDLAGVSAGATKRQQGKFFSVFITGAARSGQEYGKYQCMSNFDAGEYLIHNQESVYFIPYFIKRYWEKNIKSKNQKGEEYDKLVAFGWNDDVPKLDDQCKYMYVVAGVALNSQTKKALVHPKDIENAEIKANDPVMIYFKCAGMKFDGASKLITRLADKAKSLPPLSENPEFESKVVTPRRFIIAATVTLAPSDHGDKQVFSFNPEIQLPDKAVEQVMNSAKTLKVDFEKQFDKTHLVKSGGSGSGSSKPSGGSSDNGQVAFEAPAANVDPSKDSNFDLGI